MMKYERYIHTVLVPHVVTTAIIFWGMVIAWLVGWMTFSDALVVALIAIALLVAHGALAAVWSVNAYTKDKAHIDESKPSHSSDNSSTEPKPLLTIDRPSTEPKAAAIGDKTPVLVKHPTDELPKIVPLPSQEPAPLKPSIVAAEPESPKPTETVTPPTTTDSADSESPKPTP